MALLYTTILQKMELVCTKYRSVDIATWHYESTIPWVTAHLFGNMVDSFESIFAN